MTTPNNPGDRPTAAPVPHLREVLGAAALASGLSLADGPDGALTRAQAEDAAVRWGLMPVGGAASAPPTVVVLVDGLGLDQLRERRGHAPVLRGLLADSEAAARAGQGPGPDAVTCRPSTTAAALTALGTGALPGTTGMVGYSVRNPLLPPASAEGAPAGSDLLSLISWEGHCPDPRAWQDVPTIFERLRPADRPAADRPLAVTIGPARFAGSGLTEAGLRGAPHIGADAMESRAGHAAEALRRGVPLVYLYVGELDHAGHAHGWRSQKWLAQLERLDALMAELVRRVPRGTRIMLTADHGMVDTDDEHRLLVTDSPRLMRDVACVAGEPRFTHLYVGGRDDAERSERAAAVAERWRAELGERALWVGTRDEAGEHLGPLSERARGVTGDVLVAAAGAWVVLDPRVHADAVLGMPGVHGSFTGAETRIPLLITSA
ncbi:alkaline phosphatase family protein [Actinomyces marmotae]|uniref:PglZ domain-containing protein n=1 Tax=Actinomyces marmotae TaxID=2737173 RepID=A0A6M8B059_9ACTO|nr:alkaline phosphatase family protein [Actinomyces marmotae]QKD79638.1 PglZ domain-containing protein [Actinomyces marmotae]